MRTTLPFIFVALLLALPAMAGSPWQSVTGRSKSDGYYIPQTVTVSAEQARLETATLKHQGPTGYGYSGPQNIHTRKLSFVCQGVRYSIPQSFADDLLNLHVRDRKAWASINGSDVVLSLYGSDGEKGYEAHFHFPAGKFHQRILAYSEAQIILIRNYGA